MTEPCKDCGKADEVTEGSICRDCWIIRYRKQLKEMEELLEDPDQAREE